MMDLSILVTLLCLSFARCRAGIPWLISEEEKDSWKLGPNEKCYFAKKWYSIGQTFKPRLNPFGLMPCMNCTCRKNPQFPFLKPRVSCNNIRNSCPLVSCADPIVKKGECCPSCHDEFVGNLLVPAVSTSSNVSSYGRIHITIARQIIYISIHIEGLQNFNKLELKHQDGSTLQVISSEDVEFIRLSGKICLESTILKLNLLNFLRNHVVTVQLFQNDSVQLEGALVSFSKFSEVPFVALLTVNGYPNRSYIRGGFVSMLPNVYNNRVAINVILASGKITRRKSTDRSVVVAVKILKRPWKADKKSQLVKSFSFNLLESELDSDKPISRKFDWLKPRNAHMRWMVRGILFVTIETRLRNEKSRLFGRVMVHQTCRNFFSILSGGVLDHSSSTSASGSVLLSVDARAKIHFKASGRSAAQAERVDLLAVDEDAVLIKKLGTVRRNPDEDNFVIAGTWERPSAKDLTMIFKGGMFIKISSHVQPKGYMGGRILQFLYLFAADYSKGSLLSVNSVNSKLNTKLAATAVLSADSKCNLHYVIIIGGYGETSSAYRMIEGRLEFDAIYSRRTNSRKEIKLAKFNKNYISRGSFIKPTRQMLNGIASEMAKIEIITRRFTTGELKGQISLSSSQCNKVKVSNNNNKDYLQRSLITTDRNIGVCLHQGRFHDNNAKWHPTSKDGGKMYCRVCRCKHRHVTCKDTVCPKPSCLNPSFVRENCCPVCTGPPSGKWIDPTKACIIGMASRNEIRAIGEAWHPMMPPFGMVKCIVCICKSAPGGYKCTRVECPKLNCENPQRTPGACCSTCPVTKVGHTTTEVKDVLPKDVASSRRKKVSCSYAKKSYPHGTSWKPILPQFGILRCVICRCKNGRVRCRRLKCLKSARCRMRNGRVPSDPCCKHCTVSKKT